MTTADIAMFRQIAREEVRNLLAGLIDRIDDTLPLMESPVTSVSVAVTDKDRGSLTDDEVAQAVALPVRTHSKVQMFQQPRHLRPRQELRSGLP